MTIDIFNQSQFEAALAPHTFKSLGYVGQELTYEIPVDAKVSIEIRSTIWRDGLSATNGEDSIRMWLRTADGKPLGKLDKWTTRVAGWEKRVAEKIAALIELRTVAGDCPNCKNPLACFITGPGSKNEGRIYAKCMKENKWTKWVTVKLDGVPFKSNPMPTAPKSKSQGNIATALAQSEAPAIVNRTFAPSPQQEAIAQFAVNDTRNLENEAVAGSGKTTSNVYLASKLPSHLRVAAMVFNKRNAIDMQKKLPEHVVASTAHSAAFKDVMRATKGVKVDDKNRKMWDLFNAELHTLKENDKEATADELQLNGSEIIRLVSLVKNTLKEPTDANLNQLSDHHGILLNGAQEDAYKTVRTLMQKSDEIGAQLIDFDDMVNYPARGEVAGRKYAVTQYDLLLVDEAQDTNKAQQEYYLKAGKRIIFVGDRGQAIYGFRGADVDAMDNLSNALHAEKLPLSVCYRCAKSIVALAKEIVPQIEWAPNAPEGTVKTIDADAFMPNVKPGDMVLCRLNAPLVAPAFELIRNGIKATILGKEIGVGLLTLVNKVQRKHGIDGTELLLILSKLAEYGAGEALRLRAARKENQATMLEDQVETLIALASGCETVSQLKVRIAGDPARGIKGIFSDDVEGTVFSSVHKAKGHEADNVFILRPDLMPFPKAREPWQKVQEMNIKYVAITRAKKNLTWVVGG